ncbi:hypothetical protein BIV59_08400 [Bacillus sp. MUM 13]|nr:hypothetical protein BIV59_08400 [Bacillus sp. MUM 13]
MKAGKSNSRKLPGSWHLRALIDSYFLMIFMYKKDKKGLSLKHDEFFIVIPLFRACCMQAIFLGSFINFG